jgi:hypothetical protein
LSGGEPGARRDLLDITTGAHEPVFTPISSPPRSGSRTRPLGH